MSNEIKVSVICITYNHERYIRDCLEGFVMQKTNFPFEVIIHDDASTDKTAEIIREYEKKYPDIIKPIYQTENQYSKRIPFLERYIRPRLQGDYIAVCEGDDYWIDPLKLQKQYDFMQTHPECSGCVGGARIETFDDQRDVYNKFPTEKSRYVTMEEAIEFGMFYPTATIFLPIKEQNAKDEFADLNLSFGDYTGILNICLHGKLYAFHEVFAVYRAFISGSWSERMEKDINMAINVREQNARLYERLNKLTNQAYKPLTDRLLRAIDFDILYRQGNKKEMRKPQYREFYRKRFSLTNRTKRFLSKHAPVVYKIERKIRRLYRGE